MTPTRPVFFLSHELHFPPLTHEHHFSLTHTNCISLAHELCLSCFLPLAHANFCSRRCQYRAGHLLQKSSTIRGSFVERDLQEVKSYGTLSNHSRTCVLGVANIVHGAKDTVNFNVSHTKCTALAHELVSRLPSSSLAQTCAVGVVNIVHGAKDTVNFICDNSAIKSVSFVGSNQVRLFVHQAAYLSVPPHSNTMCAWK